MTPTKSLAVILSAAILFPSAAVAGPVTTASASSGFGGGVAPVYTGTRSFSTPGTETGTAVPLNLGVAKIPEGRFDGIAFSYTGTRTTPSTETGTAVVETGTLTLPKSSIAEVYTGTRTRGPMGSEAGTALSSRSDGVAYAYTGTRTKPSISVDGYAAKSHGAPVQMGMTDSGGLSLLLGAALLFRSITRGGIGRAQPEPALAYSRP